MFSSALHTKAVQLTTTGLIAAFLAVCVVSVAPGLVTTTSAATTSVEPASAKTDGSAKTILADGFHW